VNIYKAFPTAIATAVPTLSKRVFPAYSVEGFASPYCSYQEIYVDRLQTLDGYAGEATFEYQFNFWDVSYDQAKTNATAFWDYINTVTGAFGDYILDNVQHIHETEDTDMAAAKIKFNAILELRFICRTA
jgi:hypothetical protein